MVWTLPPTIATKLQHVSPSLFCELVNAGFRLEPADLDYIFAYIQSDGSVKEGVDITDEIQWRSAVLQQQSPLDPDFVPPIVHRVQEKSRAAFPLRFRKAEQYIEHRVALIGYVVVR